MIEYSDEVEFKIMQQALKEIKKCALEYKDGQLDIDEFLDKIEDIFIYDLSDSLIN